MAGLTDGTEALILAAQEKALGTRSIKVGVDHTRQDPRCRLCKEASETGQHIVAGGKMQEQHGLNGTNKWLALCTSTPALSMD